MYRSDVLVRTWKLNCKELFEERYLLAPIESEYEMSGTFRLFSYIIITDSSFISLMNRMTRLYPINFPCSRVLSIDESELYNWIRCEDIVSPYLLESISIHRKLDLGEIWKLHQSKSINICNILSFADVTVKTLYKLMSSTLDLQDVKFLSKALNSTKADKQIRKLSFSYTCNPKLFYLRIRYYKWCRYWTMSV